MSADEQNVTVSGTDVNVDTAGRLEVSGDHLEVASQGVDVGIAPQSDDKSLTIDVDPFDTDPVGTVNAITDAFRAVNSDAGVDASANATNDATADPTSGEDGLTDEDKEMVSLELTPLDFMIRMLGIDLAMAQIYPEPIYLATDADASDLLAREGLQYSFDANRSLYLCGMADSSIEATLKDPDLRVLALRAIKFKYRRFDQPVDDAVKAVTAALRKQQHDIAAAQAAEAAAHNSVAGPQ
ncbi:hypothetical protein PP187_gp195 [Klebsiella phage vB_KvM-Eowyn]|uniref:Uncharacterized protein n=1 Tax=Klebsiella phage vB_KvM-Eowyn TaxID=2762819 RepID=A0A7R8MJK0_9CAUD|nr:hypothetical protein PP187_gp195 [Klebsiella phage vB_KvM-Eowyn]CAD5236184.1 hypothetical protein LLCLJKAH_00195 [Klebsiella phage vB_KvM-Eowyn]